jgi:hypothetical protein
VSEGSRRRIAALRLGAQRIAAPQHAHPVEVVRHLLAVQAQDYPNALWAIGSRTTAPSRSAVLDALGASGRPVIVRAWPLRGTLHAVAVEDLDGLLDLTAERTLRGMAGILRNRELDAGALTTARTVVEERLSAGPSTRSDLFAALERTGFATGAQRGITAVNVLALERALVVAPHVGREAVYVRYADVVPSRGRRDREELLAELALRYVRSRGPATEPDLAWWSGLPLTVVRRAVDSVREQVERVGIDGTDYLVPAGGPEPIPGRAPRIRLVAGFDEHLLGYRDRSAQLDPQDAPRVVPGGGGVLRPTIAAGGRLVGTWRRGGGSGVEADWWRAPSASEEAAFTVEAARYARFLDG